MDLDRPGPKVRSGGTLAIASFDEDQREDHSSQAQLERAI